MSSYRTLAPLYVGTSYIEAGTTLSTIDVGGSLPTNWIPPGAVEPLDVAATNAFYAAGPQPAGLIRPQWSTIPVNVPATYWKQTGRTWTLTGLGANLPPIPI